MSVLLSELLVTLAFTVMLLFSAWMLIDRRRLSHRPVEHLARAFRRAATAASIEVAPSRYQLSPEMITEVAAVHGLRFNGQQELTGRLRMSYSPAPALPEGEDDD